MPSHSLTVARAPNSFVIQLSSEEQDLFSFTGKMYVQYTYSIPEQLIWPYFLLLPCGSHMFRV